MKEGLKCRFVIEERVPGSYKKEAGGNNFMFELMGVEAITVVPGGTNMGEAMSRVAQEVASLGRKAYVIPGGGSNAIGGLGYVACVQEMQQQCTDADAQCSQLRERIRTTTEKQTKTQLKQQLKEQERVAKQLKKELRAREREVKRLGQSSSQ